MFQQKERRDSLFLGATFIKHANGEGQRDELDYEMVVVVLVVVGFDHFPEGCRGE